MARFVIRNIFKVLQATSGRLFGRVSAGTGPAEELTPTQVRNLLSVLTSTEIAAAYQPIGNYAVTTHTHDDRYYTETESDALYAAIGHNHSGVYSPVGHGHVAFEVADFAESVDDRVAALLVQGANITLTYNDAANTLTVSGTGGSPGGSTKQVQYNSSGSFGGASGFEYQSGASPNVALTSQNASHVPLCVVGAASQSANLVELKKSDGTVLVQIKGTDGEIASGGVGGGSFGAKIGRNGAVGSYCVGTVSGIGFSGLPDILPTDGSAGLTNGTVALGRSAYRYSTVFATKLDLTGALIVGVYTFATVPSASANTGATIRISDRSHRLATSDGSAWNWTGTTTAIS